MNKKIVTVSIIVVILIAVVLGIVFLIPKSPAEDVVDTPVASVEVPEETTPVPSTTPVTDEEVFVPIDGNIDFTFDNKVTINITGDDYITDLDSFDEFTEQQKKESGEKTSYSFSNGVVVFPTEKIEILSDMDAVVEAQTSDGKYSIWVREIDPLRNTIFDLVSEQVKTVQIKPGFFMKIEKDIPIGAVVLGEGLPNYSEYFPEDINWDASINALGQVMAYFKDECSYGEVTMIIVYDSMYGSYTGNAYIQCDNDRLLHILIKSSEYKDMYNCVLELTNNNIRLYQ